MHELADLSPDTATVDTIRDVVEERLQALQPLVEESRRLTAVLGLLDAPGATTGPALAAVADLGAERPGDGGELRPFVRYGRRGTRKGRDGRAPQGHNKQIILAVILDRPGITAPEVAARTGIKRTVVSATVTRLKRGGELETWGEGVRVPLVAASDARAAR